MFSFGSLHLCPIVFGWSLSDDFSVRCQSISLAEYCMASYISNFFSPIVFGSVLGIYATLPLGAGTTGSTNIGSTLLAWVSGYTSHWWATPTLFVSSYPAYSIGWTDCRFSLMWLGWCTKQLTRTLAWSKKVVISGQLFTFASNLSWYYQ